jgi:hypothetical protein
VLRIGMLERLTHETCVLGEFRRDATRAQQFGHWVTASRVSALNRCSPGVNDSSQSRAGVVSPSSSSSSERAPSSSALVASNAAISLSGRPR